MVIVVVQIPDEPIYISHSANTLHHHHHLAPSARISLTLSRHPALSSIASGRFLRLHPVSTQSCCMYVRADCPAFARPCEEVYRSTSFMSSFLLLQQCPACLVRLILIVFVMGGRWPYSCCFVGCCLQDLFLRKYKNPAIFHPGMGKIVG